MQICVSDIFLLKVLTKSVFYRIIIKVLFILRGVAQLVARQFWELDVAGSSPVTPTTSERTLICSDFSMQKNQSHVPSFLLFRKRSHSRRLFGCKRPHSAFGSLPTFCGLRLWRSLISKRFISFKIIRAYEC